MRKAERRTWRSLVTAGFVLTCREQRLSFVKFIREFVNGRDTIHEIVVISVSYVFVFFGAWNDRLIGFAPSPLSHVAELLMAFVLASEIASRMLFSTHRTLTYWLILSLDCISVFTVVPGFRWATFARLARMLYAGVRLVGVLDKIACRRKNAMFLVTLYPVTVPLVAAVVYAIEKHSRGSDIHTYVDALVLCFQYSLSLGQVRPQNPWAMALCGGLFLAGIVCIGIATNAISNRYQPEEAA